MKRVLAALVCCAAAFTAAAAEAETQNTIIRVSGGGAYSWARLTIGGRDTRWLYLCRSAQPGDQYHAEWYLNDYWGTTGLGSSNYTLTYLDPALGSNPSGFDIELKGIYAGQDVAFSLDEVLNDGGTVTAVKIQTGGEVEEPPPPPEPEPATNEKLDELGAKLDSLVFLGQSIAQTMGLICGGLLWRTIVVAARLK